MGCVKNDGWIGKSKQTCNFNVFQVKKKSTKSFFLGIQLKYFVHFTPDIVEIFLKNRSSKLSRSTGVTPT